MPAGEKIGKKSGKKSYRNYPRPPGSPRPKAAGAAKRALSLNKIHLLYYFFYIIKF